MVHQRSSRARSNATLCLSENTGSQVGARGSLVYNKTRDTRSLLLEGSLSLEFFIALLRSREPGQLRLCSSHGSILLGGLAATPGVLRPSCWVVCTGALPLQGVTKLMNSLKCFIFTLILRLFLILKYSIV